jgi:hypothetical protein
MEDQFRKYENSEYDDGIILNEYNGTISLITAFEGKDGPVKKWCYPERNRKPLDKPIPWKVKLGESREEALEAVKWLWQALGGETEDPNVPF